MNFNPIVQQPGALRDGVFGAYNNPNPLVQQPYQVRNGVFGAADAGPLAAVDGLIVLSEVGEHSFNALQSGACVQLVPTPSADQIYQLTGTAAGQCGTDNTSILSDVIANLAQQGFVPLVETTFFLTGAYYSKVIFTKNPQVILQMCSGLNLLTTAPSMSKFAVAQTALSKEGLQAVSDARAAYRALMPPGTVKSTTPAKASFLSSGTGALVVVGAGVLLLWALTSKKKHA